MKPNTIRKIACLSIIFVLAVFLGGCTPDFEIKGTYTIYKVELAPNISDTYTIANFDEHSGYEFKVRLEESATVSFIFFTKLMSGVYYANVYTGTLSYQTSGSRIILNGDISGDGVLDIEVYDCGWLILEYKINNRLVYTAKYRK